MRNGDIILELDGVQTLRIEGLAEAIHQRKVGDAVRIFAVRNGGEHLFELNLTEAS